MKTLDCSGLNGKYEFDGRAKDASLRTIWVLHQHHGGQVQSIRSPVREVMGEELIDVGESRQSASHTKGYLLCPLAWAHWCGAAVESVFGRTNSEFKTIDKVPLLQTEILLYHFTTYGTTLILVCVAATLQY